MSAVRKPELAPAPVSSPGARAKPLRRAQDGAALRPETLSALLAYDRSVGPRETRRLASVLAHAVLGEARAGSPAIPEDLAALAIKWDDDQWEGTDIDYEVADFAVQALLASNE